MTEYVNVSCLPLSEKLCFNECDLCLMEMYILREHKRTDTSFQSGHQGMLPV